MSILTISIQSSNGCSPSSKLLFYCFLIFLGLWKELRLILVFATTVKIIYHDRGQALIWTKLFYLIFFTSPLGSCCEHSLGNFAACVNSRVRYKNIAV